MRGVTCDRFVLQKMWSFLLTRLMRGVTAIIIDHVNNVAISTHTPHARRDLQYAGRLGAVGNFYSHASCEA